MLEFSSTFSLGESLLSFVASEIPSTKEDGSYCSPEERAQAALKLLQARVVGREKDGAVLVAWTGVSADQSSAETPVTLFGLLEGRNPITLIYAHDKLIHVVSASIDQGRSLLGFTELSQVVDSHSANVGEKNASSDDAEAVYQSYVVELQPTGRVHALQVERNRCQRTQFVYAGTSRLIASRDVYMLFLLHQESVGMYHFKLDQVGDALVLAGQPVTCELCSQPLWFQWSHAFQRLYFVCDKPQLGDSKGILGEADSFDDSDSSEDALHPVLRVVEFFEDGAHEMVLDVRLPFEMNEIDPSIVPAYCNKHAWCESVPDMRCNMAVLQLGSEQRIGSLCIVYQHALQRSRRNTPRLTSPLKYSVCILHHAYRMEVSMPTVPALTEERTPQPLLFTTLGDYVMIWLPGKVLHLLDCSTEHGAFHHILLQESVPALPFKSLSACPWSSGIALGAAASLFDSCRQEAYTVSIQRQELVELFSETQQESFRAASLHFALIHQCDNGLACKMIEHLCRDPAAPDCTMLLAEYLLAASYAHMRREGLPPNIMQLLPISLAGAFRNQVEEGRDGQNVRIFYSRMHGLKDQLIGWQPDATQQPLAQIIVPPPNKLLLGLQRNLMLRDGPARFNLLAIKQKLESAPPASPTSEFAPQSPVAAPQSETRSFLRRLSSSLSGRRPPVARPHRSKSDMSSSTSLPFLETQPEEEFVADRRRCLVVEHLHRHLKGNSHESADRCHQIAQEYASTQMHHSKFLLNTIWTSLRPPGQGQPSQVLLSDRGGPRDKALFTMAEHFSAAVRSCGFPTPSGFNQFFAALGLRCLEPLVFLQYAQQNVFSLPNDFVRRVVHELNDTPENAELKFQVCTVWDATVR